MEGGLDFYKRSLDVVFNLVEGIGVGVILRSIVNVVEGTGLFNGEVLK